MTMSTIRTTRRLALALASLALLGAHGQAHSQVEGLLPKLAWKQHGTDAAVEGAKFGAEQVTDGDLVATAVQVVDTAVDSAATASGAGTAIAVVSKSGPAILSTLKVAGGPVAAGGAAGFGVAGLQEKYLYSDCDQQTACDVAAISGYAGAAAGTAGAVGLSATFGLGASGLAGIGAMVGGGMAAGAVTLITLPAVAAVAVAGGAYLATAWVVE
ncbi:MAG: hypothetical protein WBJ41_08895 [Chromatiaceae bacterium]